MSESVSVVDKIIAGLVEWPADSRRLDPAGVSAAAKALHMWEHGDPTDYADPDYRECVEVAVSAYLAVAGSPAAAGSDGRDAPNQTGSPADDQAWRWTIHVCPKGHKSLEPPLDGVCWKCWPGGQGPAEEHIAIRVAEVRR